jgi:hypothetical protein
MKREYIGDSFRKTMRKNSISNKLLLKMLKKKGLVFNEAKFSNKLYGDREFFSKEEEATIQETLTFLEECFGSV